MRLLGSEYLIVGGISAVIVSFSLLFYFDITKKVDSGQSEIVGSVSFKRKTAQRKYSSQVVWEDVQQEAPIYNYDSIRTSDLSEAVITLKDGTKISIDENSMILIALSGDEVDIDFTQGSIKASRDDVKGKELKTLQIKSSGTTVSIDKSDVSLTQEKGKELSLTVNKGDATIDAGGEKQVVKEDQKIIASKDDLKVFELKLKLTTPEPRAYITTTGPRKNISFGWEDVKDAYDLTLEVSTDKYFESGVKKIRVKGSAASYPLAEGNYYWRITAVERKSKKMELSEIRRISIIRDDAIQLIAPENNAVVYYRNKLPLINFKWLEDNVASSYSMIIASDRKMENIISTSDVNSPSLTVFDLEEGRYYWKVKKIARVEGLNLEGSSPVYTLSVQKKDQIEPPVLISPAENKKINRIVLKKKHVTFSWDKDKEIVKSRIYISRDKEFKNIFFSADTENNFFRYDRDTAEGTYYWRVTGILKDEETTNPSLTRPFSIVESQDITLVKPGKNASIPLEQDMNTAEVNFAWERINLEGTFKIEVARNSSFSDIYKEGETSDFYFTTEGLKSGAYYWRVIMQDEDGADLLKSPVRNFTVLSGLKAPLALSPSAGDIVNMVDKKTLRFSWKALSGANQYKLSLYQNKGSIKQWITSTETSNTFFEISDLKKLDIGSFTWTLQALDKEKSSGKILRKSPVSQNNFKISLGKTKDSIKIKVPDVIYVE